MFLGKLWLRDRWGKCLFGLHQWDGCRCIRCAAVDMYAEQNVHDWDGCKCKQCGKVRESPNAHDWEQCRCRRCGKINHINVGQCHCGRCAEEVETYHIYEFVDEFVDTTSWGKVFRCTRCGKEAKVEEDGLTSTDITNWNR